MRTNRSVLLLSLAGLAFAGCSARPADEGGSNPFPSSGAHTVHLAVPLPLPDNPDNRMTCRECHNPQFEVTLEGPTARANGAVGTYSNSTQTCSGVYCHDGGVTQAVLGGGTVPVPSWNPPSSVTCGACHAIPGGAVVTTSWHPNVAPAAECALCHPGYTRTSVNVALHVNTVVNLVPPTLGSTCSACHGLEGRAGDPVARAAPPKDRSGNSDTRFPGVGAHQAHLNPPAGAISLPIACNQCHVVPPVTGPDRLKHVGPTPTTPATLAWGTLASADQAEPVYDRASATCTNYCHGQTLAANGINTTPIWTKVDGTQATCGTCHASPPNDLGHVVHVSTAAPNFPCATCHPAGYSRYAVAAAAVPYHVNGVRDVNATTLPDWNPATPGPAGWTGTSVGCHGGTRYWTSGFPNSTCY